MGEPKAWPAVETFYGTDGEHWTAYLTRVALTKRLSLHLFHRGDADPDPHDHKQGFFTFPLTSYVEEVYDHARDIVSFRVVKAFRPHYRPAHYAHRVLGPWTRGRRVAGGIVTLVLWIGKRRDVWGFWVRSGDSGRRWVPWRTYIYGEAAQ